jgi:hypothetical protein
MQDMDVEFEIADNFGPIENRVMSAPPSAAALRAKHAQTGAAEHLERAAQQLLARYPDATAWSYDRLAEVNMAADIIDACKAITGYPEAQIVLALMICILGPDRVGLPADVVAAVPAALLGGLRVIIVRS